MPATNNDARRESLLEERERLILKRRKLEATIYDESGNHRRNVTEEEADRILDEVDVILDRLEAILEEYGKVLPRMILSRSPNNGEPYIRSFDPIDLRGFWWMNRTRRTYEEPPLPYDFKLLLGAVNLNDLPPLTGRHVCRLGPAVPYVVPSILIQSKMIAVISSIKMKCGYTAYPIVYFSNVAPEEGSLTQGWGEEICYTAKGWTIKDELWDFDLAKWIQKGKLRWCAPDDENMELCPIDSPCPYLDLPGVREKQVLQGEKYWSDGVPSGKDIQPK